MNKKVITTVIEVMKVPIEVAEEHFKELPEHNAYYFWNPVKGGIAVIVGKNGKNLQHHLV